MIIMNLIMNNEEMIIDVICLAFEIIFPDRERNSKGGGGSGGDDHHAGWNDDDYDKDNNDADDDDDSERDFLYLI